MSEFSDGIKRSLEEALAFTKGEIALNTRSVAMYTTKTGRRFYVRNQLKKRFVGELIKPNNSCEKRLRIAKEITSGRDVP